MRVLGIETSCDETAAAVVARAADGSAHILANVIHSQIGDHALYGGVVPEIAARAHVERLDGIIAQAMAEAEMDFNDIDAVAATAGPGLIGGLIVGLMTAKAIAAAKGKPLVAINHLEAHALTPRMTDGLEFPYLLLLVSGGHTQLLAIEGVGKYSRWGTTIDDALGEAFDKTAKLLELGYPGGPLIERAAVHGDSNRFQFPRPLRGRETMDFSFAGLKTAVRLQCVRIAPLDAAGINDICASFQAAVGDILCDRVGRALEKFADTFPQVALNLVMAGGVAANAALRVRLGHVCEVAGARLIAPPVALCTDNAAMVAWAGIERLDHEAPSLMEVSPRARWPLDPDAVPAIGSGRHGVKV